MKRPVTIQIPGDKSISHRAIILGAVANGVTRIENLLEAEDLLCTIRAMRALGATIRREGEGRWRVEGVGIRGLRSPSKVLYCGNSGTTLRLLTGLLSGSPVIATLTGDSSLNARPMGRVIEPLKKMGAAIAEIKTRSGRWIRISGRSLKGGSFKLPVASAQLKSALLLAGLNASGWVTVTEPASTKSRDHTERMLKAFGADLRSKGSTVILCPGKKLTSCNVKIPSDFSSAAFFIVAGLIHPDPEMRVVLKDIGINPTRTGGLEVLKKMGGRISIVNRRTVCGEPIADLMIRPSPLRGTTISGPILPRLIDEIPILSVAAAVARGRTLIRDAEELRIKETDRIAALARELPRFGIRVREFRDGLEIIGNRHPVGARGKSYGDHRIAMSLTILGMVASGRTKIRDTQCIATSFPSFGRLLKKLGGHLFRD